MEMDKAWSTNGKGDKFILFLENMKGRDSFRELGVNGGMILNFISLRSKRRTVLISVMQPQFPLKMGAFHRRLYGYQFVH
jgi:hypothetical protein